VAFTWDEGCRSFKATLDDQVIATFPDPGALRGRQQLVPLPDGSTLGIGLVPNPWGRGYVLEIFRDGVPVQGPDSGVTRIAAIVVAAILGAASLLIGLTSSYDVYRCYHSSHNLHGTFSVGWVPQECFGFSPATTAPVVVCGVLALPLVAIASRLPQVGFGALAAILAVDAVLDLLYGAWIPAVSKAIWAAVFAQAFAEVNIERPPGEDRTVTKLGI
jgi:hypothetical protein